MYALAYQGSDSAEILTTSPVWGAWMNSAAADVDADVPEVGVEEDEVAGRQLVAADARPGRPQRSRVVRQRDAELAVDVDDQARAVEAGRAGAAPHVGHAEVLLRDRRGLLSQRARRGGV